MYTVIFRCIIRHIQWFSGLQCSGPGLQYQSTGGEREAGSVSGQPENITATETNRRGHAADEQVY